MVQLPPRQKQIQTCCQHTAAARPGLEELGLSKLFCLQSHLHLGIRGINSTKRQLRSNVRSIQCKTAVQTTFKDYYCWSETSLSVGSPISPASLHTTLHSFHVLSCPSFSDYRYIYIYTKTSNNRPSLWFNERKFNFIVRVIARNKIWFKYYGLFNTPLIQNVVLYLQPN